MAEAFKFDLVSPERRLASVEASEVQIPAMDGDMTAMADHTPTITTLRPGVLRVAHGGGADEYLVTGGFADINGRVVTVLAERALPRGELTRESFGALVDEYRKAAENARANGSDSADQAAKALADLTAAGAMLQLA